MIERFEPEIDAPGGGNSREAGGEARDVVDQKRARPTVAQPGLVTQHGKPRRNLLRLTDEAAMGQALRWQRIEPGRVVAR